MAAQRLLESSLSISPRPVRSQNSKTCNNVLSSRLLCLNLFVSRYHLSPPAATVLPRRLSCHSRDSPTEHAISCPAIFSLTRLLASIPRVHDGARNVSHRLLFLNLPVSLLYLCLAPGSRHSQGVDCTTADNLATIQLSMSYFT